MICGHKPKPPKTFFIENSPINTVNSFSYLDILFTDNGSWSQHILNTRAKMSRATQGIFKFSSKVGNRPTNEMVAIFKAKGASIALYGAGLWGHAKSKDLQTQENSFLKRLLYLPPTASNTIAHYEVGLLFLEDLLLARPLLLWDSIWKREETAFTKSIILDCLKLHDALKIPWLLYISSALENLYKISVWSETSKTLSHTKKKIRDTYLQYRLDLRSKAEKNKSTVAMYISDSLESSANNYLSYVTYAQHCFMLIRLRCGIVYHLIAFPKMRTPPSDEILCPCDN